MTQILKAGLLSLAFLYLQNAKGQTTEGEFLPQLWIVAGYGTPILTNSPITEGGEIEIKIGGRVANSNLTLVGGVSNSLNTTVDNPERFNLFLGPGYVFTDRIVFFSLQTGVYYPFYRNAPEAEQSVGMHNSLELGFRLVPQFALGIGFNNYITNNVPGYTLRFIAIVSIL